MNKYFLILLLSISFFNYVSAIDLDKNTYINTKNITYDTLNNTIELGEESLINYKNINILSNKGIIDYKNDKIELMDGFYFYYDQSLLSGENLKGNINLTDFKANKISYLYNNDLKIDSNEVQRSDNILTFKDSFITPCELNGYFNCPTWSFKVPRTKYIIDQDRFEHYDLFLQIADYKVFYTPYLSHYGSKAGRRAGFTYPSLDFNLLNQEVSLKTPFYIPLTKSRDIEYEPSFTINNNLNITNYRHNFYLSEKLSGGDLNLDLYNELTEGSNEPFLTLKLTTNQVLNSNARLSLNLIANNNISKSRSINKNPIPFENMYLKYEKYDFIKNDDLISFKLSTVKSYSDENNSIIPIEAPSIHYNNKVTLNNSLTNLNLLKFSYLKRDESNSNLPLDNKKININSKLINSYKINNTFIFNKVDYYLNFNESRFTSNSNLNYQKINSYIFASSEIKIPLNQYTNTKFKIIKYNGIINNNFFVNEDSNSYAFNYNNLFNENRIFGNDLIDNSSRLAIGFENQLIIASKKINLNFGQSYDLKKNSNYLKNINQTGNFSDIALEGLINFKNFDLKFDSRNNNKSLAKKEMNYSLNIYNPLTINLIYNETSSDAFKDLTSDTKKLKMSLDKKINNNISVGLSSNLDVKEKYDPYEQSIRVSFFDECSKLDISYINSRFNDNFNTKPTETIRFEFYMDYLGFVGYEQSTNLIDRSVTENYYSSK